MIKNKVYLEKEIIDQNLKPYGIDGERVTFINNIGNQYHFKKVKEGLEFISLERNKLKVFLGFHE